MELPDIEDQTAFNLERWDALLVDPAISEHLGRFETDAHGHVIMTPPPSFEHGGFQFEIGKSIERYFETGRVSMETPISTTEGVKMADATWASEAFLARLPSKCTCLPSAPEICIEVVSPSNTRAEMVEKRRLYFEAGAKEFWLCKDGAMSFYLADAEPPAERSSLCPEFPKRITL